MAARIKKGDTVVVITGSSKGVQGEVLEVRPSEDRAVVRGVAIANRHQRASRRKVELLPVRQLFTSPT